MFGVTNKKNGLRPPPSDDDDDDDGGDDDDDDEDGIIIWMLRRHHPNFCVKILQLPLVTFPSQAVHIPPKKQLAA